MSRRSWSSGGSLERRTLSLEGHLIVGSGKGVRSILCAAPFGPFRQNAPDPFSRLEYAPGNIHGEITAGKSIYLVRAKGGVNDSGYQPHDSLAEALYQTNLSVWMNDPDADPMTLPKPPRIAAPPVGGAGTVHAAIRAGSHIGAVSADRHILQPVQADQRLYLVQAGGDILQGASAGLGALTVLAGREMHGTVQAEGHVFASAYDQLAARVVSTHGAAVADSWAGISGELEGAAGVHVSAYGSISSPTITSSSGPVALGTYASVSGTVVDAARTSAVGALGRFDGQIVKADTHENLRASLTAGESIRAYVRNEVTGDITSTDGSIYVNAATIRGNRISAPNGFVGLDVFGHLGVSPAPPCPPPPGGAAVQVDRGLGITASVLGAIDGSFVSALGGVLLLADGDVSGTVSAGDDRVGIGLVSWGSVSASLTAANGPAIVAFAYGDVSGPIQAGSEVHVNTWSDLTNTVGAGGDAVILARRDVTAAVTTGRDGYVWTFDRYHGNVFAGRDGMIVSLGAVNAGIFAGGSGLIYAVENAIGSVTAGEYAGVITWGTAAGPMTVTGPEGAFGWSYGDFNGFVESSAGSASLTSYGNALGAVRGAQDASLWVLRPVGRRHPGRR